MNRLILLAVVLQTGAAMAQGSSVAALGVRAEVRPSAHIRVEPGGVVRVEAGRAKAALSLGAPAAAGSTAPLEPNSVTLNVDF